MKDNVYWTTGGGEKILIQHMTTNHIINVINFLEKKTREELEQEQVSERSLQMKKSSLITIKDELITQNSPGVKLIDESIQIVNDKLNQQNKINQVEIEQKLSNHPQYPYLKKEFLKRESNAPLIDKLDFETFLEVKTNVQIVSIQDNPENVPISMKIKTEEKEKINVGDYVANCNNPIFQITFLSKNLYKEQNNIMEIVLNAKTIYHKTVIKNLVQQNQSHPIY